MEKSKILRIMIYDHFFFGPKESYISESQADIDG